MLRSIKGFTLVEVILVILILGIIAAVIIPRITYSRVRAQIAACDSNVAAINSTLEYANVVDSVSWTTLVVGNTVNWNAASPTNELYFPDGPVIDPVDPATFTYAVNATTHRVIKHNHQ